MSQVETGVHCVLGFYSLTLCLANFYSDIRIGRRWSWHQHLDGEKREPFLITSELRSYMFNIFTLTVAQTSGYLSVKTYLVPETRAITTKTLSW